MWEAFFLLTRLQTALYGLLALFVGIVSCCFTALTLAAAPAVSVWRLLLLHLQTAVELSYDNLSYDNMLTLANKKSTEVNFPQNVIKLTALTSLLYAAN